MRIVLFLVAAVGAMMTIAVLVQTHRGAWSVALDRMQERGNLQMHGVMQRGWVWLDVADMPHEKVRVHICWGNYEGPHCCDIAMGTVFATLMSTKSRYVLFETANPRHGHEWRVFRDRADEIPEGKVLIPGAVDTTTNFIEHPDLVSERLQRFVDIVGPERVIAGSDCGFGTFAGFGAVDPEIAWAKLATLAEGARGLA